MMSLSWLTTDGELVLAARVVRTFAYGFLSIVLAIYIKLIGFNDILIGLVLAATLANSVIFTIIASFYADRIGRRDSMMAATCAASPICSLSHLSKCPRCHAEIRPNNTGSP